MTRYFVRHDTRYEYEHPVSLSRQVVHLLPRTTPFQTVELHRLSVEPEPEVLATRADFFGNQTTSLCIDRDHESLFVRADSWVEVVAREYPEDDSTDSWELVRERLAYRAERPQSDAELEATRFCFESTRVRNKRELAAWALACFGPGTPLLRGVRALMNRIHDELVFDPSATTVSTPVMDVFSNRRGVCQDFAHLMLSCLRSIGLAGRYVSGYLLTKPPAGKPRLVGADASHAWVSVYCPGFGWVDADPTNRMFATSEHVTVGYGRDYDDVIPLRGVILGGGAHTLQIAVTVVPASDYASLFPEQA